MISARLRFVVLVAAAVAAAAMAGLYARAGLVVPGAMPCLVLAGFLAEAAAYVRRSAYRLQKRHHQALLLAELEAIDPRPNWCCERGWLTRGDLHHPIHCTRSI